jgi:ankyrin repeat protein
MIAFLLDANADIEARDCFGASALHLASLVGHEVAVKYLIDEGAEVNIADVKGRTPLILASNSGFANVVKTLLAAKAERLSKNEDGFTALHCASIEGHDHVVVLLLDAEAEINKSDQHNAADLHSVFMSGDSEEGNVSIAERSLVGARSNYGETALHHAASGGHVPVVRALLALSEINAQSNQGNTPLHLASYMGHANVMRLLLENGADMTLKAKGSWTALHYGARYGNTEVVKVLLDEMANPSEQSSRGCTPSNLASTKADVKVARLFPEKNADGVCRLDGGNLLSAPSEGDDSEVTTVLSSENEGISIRTDGGQTALILAASGGHIDILKILLDTEANVDDRD